MRQLKKECILRHLRLEQSISLFLLATILGQTKFQIHLQQKLIQLLSISPYSTVCVGGESKKTKKEESQEKQWANKQK